jgi:hypothetical protein
VISDGNPGLGAALDRLWPGVAHHERHSFDVASRLLVPNKTASFPQQDFHSRPEQGNFDFGNPTTIASPQNEVL